MKRFLLMVVLTMSCSAFGGNLTEDTANFLNLAFPDLAVSESIYCSPAKQTHKSDLSHADYLLNITSADNIVLFVHGYAANQREGQYTLDKMATLWRYHVDLLEEVKGSTSYCVVTWDTHYGFDEETATLGRFLTVLDTALRDRRASHKKTNVTVVGHGAGGNYIKYSYLYFLKSGQAQNKFSPPLDKRNYKFHIVTLSTPHLGIPTKNSDKLDASAYMMRIGSYLLGDIGALTRPMTKSMVHSRGAKQMKEIEDNEALYQLNRSFAKLYPKSEIFAVGSSWDKVVTVGSATPGFTRTFTLDVDHKSFLQPYKNIAFSSFLKTIYQGKHPE